MGPSYSWHPGAGGINTRWGVPVPLLPDEIISSWLVRAALKQGCDPLVLTGELWPKWRIWTQDADRFPDDARIEPICRVSGIEKEALVQATLYPVARKIMGGNLPEKAVWPWILALGTRNTKRHGGMQYCPACLAEDQTAYYRIQWRFAWHVGCDRHGCLLLDHCPVCKAPVEPHRLLAEDQDMGLCATCKVDLSGAEHTASPADVQAYQRLADQAICTGQGMFQGRIVDTREWFELSSFFTSMIHRASRSQSRVLCEFLQRLGVTLPEDLPHQAGAGIELLRTHERQVLLEGFYRLMIVGKDEFEYAVKDSGIALQTFCEKSGTLPEELREIAAALPNIPRIRTRKAKVRLVGPRPPYEVKRMMARLLRKLEFSRR